MTAGDKSRRRQVSDEERALWSSVTRSVSPLRRHRQDAEPVIEDAAPGPKPDARPPSSASVVAPPPRGASKPTAPALAPLHRRDKQRLARGAQAIDARLDLHGRSQSQAHVALLRFLRQAQADGAKTVLVITGKGAGAGERGVLKRQVPQWLALPEFRPLVVGFGDASVSHGGDGALYVRVRRGFLR